MNIPRPSPLLVLLTVVSASCARATSDFHGPAPQRLPVGVRSVAQPPAASSDAALTMDLSAYLAPEPGEVDVHVRVEPDSRSRSVTIEWWTTDGVGGSHLIPLQGERSQVRYTYPIKRMSQGEYIVSAVLQRNDGSEIKSTRRVIVTGQNGMLADAHSEPSGSSGR